MFRLIALIVFILVFGNGTGSAATAPRNDLECRWQNETVNTCYYQCGVAELEVDLGEVLF